MRGLSHLSRSVIPRSLQGLVYMQKSTWIRAAVLLVAVARIVAYNTGVWVHVFGCFSFWSANWVWFSEVGFFPNRVQTWTALSLALWQ